MQRHRRRRRQSGRRPEGLAPEYRPADAASGFMPEYLRDESVREGSLRKSRSWPRDRSPEALIGRLRRRRVRRADTHLRTECGNGSRRFGVERNGRKQAIVADRNASPFSSATFTDAALVGKKSEKRPWGIARKVEAAVLVRGLLEKAHLPASHRTGLSDVFRALLVVDAERRPRHGVESTHRISRPHTEQTP